MPRRKSHFRTIKVKNGCTRRVKVNSSITKKPRKRK